MRAVVVTPTTGGPHLRRCLHSVQAQSYAALRQVVVVDGPEPAESVRQVVAELQPGDRRVDVLQLPWNTGGQGYFGHRVYAACSFLVDEPVIFNLDADNWIDPDHIARGMDALRSLAADWAFSLRRIHTADGTPVCNDDCDSLGAWPRYPSLFLGRDEMTEQEEAFLSRYPYLVDTSCYAIRTPLYRLISRHWFFGYGADCVVATKLVKRTTAATTGGYSLNYRLGSASEVPPSYFLHGNAVIGLLYGDRRPWAGAPRVVRRSQHPPWPAALREVGLSRRAGQP